MGGKPLPAELVVLYAELQDGEAGVWLNSRGTSTGAVDLVRGAGGKLRTARVELPHFVSAAVESLYEATGLLEGAPDLVVWSEVDHSIRFIEVKCPHWDRPSDAQLKFMQAAEQRGYGTSISEWEFVE
jgi:hypothetical protein